jgi:membrane protein
MKLLQTLRQRLFRMLTSPGEELGSWARFVQYQMRLWYFCLRRLRDDNAMAMSAALTFRTIFAMVPVFVLGVVVLRSFGALEHSKQALGDWLDRSNLSQIALVGEPASGATQPATRPAGAGATQPRSQPATAAAAGPTTRTRKVINLADEIEKLVARVEEKLTFGRIGPIGVALLIWSALTLLITMERSLNRIFGARRARGTARRVMLYWSAMTLGPIALMVAAYVGDRATASFHDIGGVGWVLAVVGWVQPIVVGVALLTAVYVLMPNTSVSLRAAFGGAVVAFPLWLVAKWAFTLYVTEVVGTNPLYGSLGLLPLFLLWLNLSWLLFLFGAELAATAANLGRMTFARQKERTFLGPWDLVAAAAAIARPYLAGRPAPNADRLAADLNLPGSSVGMLLERLAARGVVCPIRGGSAPGYVPARAPQGIRLADVMDIARPDGPDGGADRFQPELAEVVRRVQSQTRDALKDMTLTDLLAGGGTAPPPAS